MVSTDTGLTGYLSTVLEQMSGMLSRPPHHLNTLHTLVTSEPLHMDDAYRVKNCQSNNQICCPADWLVRGELQKMVLVITSSETGETLERWTFDLQTDKSVVDGA